jgi:isopenicillin N synthase-like dioxygenase
MFETVTSLEDGKDTSLLPWHARYVVMMPGEFLQIVTRNEVPAAVHRVVAAKGEARLSAPILLRGRPGTKLDVARYLGEKNHPLLIQCDGMNMEQIHQAMQPTSFE